MFTKERQGEFSFFKLSCVAESVYRTHLQKLQTSRTLEVSDKDLELDITVSYSGITSNYWTVQTWWTRIIVTSTTLLTFHLSLISSFSRWLRICGLEGATSHWATGVEKPLEPNCRRVCVCGTKSAHQDRTRTALILWRLAGFFFCQTKLAKCLGLGLGLNIGAALTMNK